MFHSNTQRLIDYWRARKPADGAPPRSAIDPIELSTLLPQVFILGRRGPGDYVFRLAGGLVTDLHGRDLRQAAFVSLFASDDRQRLAAGLESARRRDEPLVASVRATTADGEAVIEMLLAPIAASPGEPERTLGLYQPVESLAKLGGGTIELFTLLALTATDGRAALPALRLAAVDGRRVA